MDCDLSLQEVHFFPHVFPSDLEFSLNWLLMNKSHISRSAYSWLHLPVGKGAQMQKIWAMQLVINNDWDVICHGRHTGFRCPASCSLNYREVVRQRIQYVTLTGERIASLLCNSVSKICMSIHTHTHTCLNNIHCWTFYCITSLNFFWQIHRYF